MKDWKIHNIIKYTGYENILYMHMCVQALWLFYSLQSQYVEHGIGLTSDSLQTSAGTLPPFKNFDSGFEPKASRLQWSLYVLLRGSPLPVQVRLIGNSLLPISVNVSMNSCPSLNVSPATYPGWTPPVSDPMTAGTDSSRPSTFNRKLPYSWWMDVCTLPPSCGVWVYFLSVEGSTCFYRALCWWKRFWSATYINTCYILASVHCKSLN